MEYSPLDDLPIEDSPVEDLQAQLQASIDQAELEWLLPHIERNAVVIVAPSLDLVTVGTAIAADQVAIVQDWIQAQLLYKPSPVQIEHWHQNPQQRFTSLIVQPYVLIQELIAS